MNLWLGAATALLCALAGVGLGWAFSQLRRPYWVISYLIPDGLEAKCRVFKNISELKQAGLTLALIKYGFMVDHWVTVFEVTDSEVVVGDPASGLGRLSYDEFSKRWRFVGIVLQRKATGS